MSEFNFKSQICTSREQSERLLELGLKKETADCGHSYGRQEHEEYEDWEIIILDDNWQPYWDVTDEEIPAWTLHRLLMMIDSDIQTDGRYVSLPDYGFVKNDNIYDNLCDCIEWLIKEGYFNKEYLV